MAAPYGTRSRNRTGITRPNYAEDRDIEMDNFEDYHSTDHQDTSTKKSTRHSLLTGPSDAQGRASLGSRKSGIDGAKGALTQLDPARERTVINGIDSDDAGGGSGLGGGTGGAGTSSQIAQSSSALQPSRKRKAAAASRHTETSMPATTTMASSLPETNLMSFSNCRWMPEHGRMKADDGTILEPNDHVYLVCEPPGEPYYLGRIMEFLHAQNDGSRPVDAVRINWYYRPKDIGRKALDTRQVFATMHSDISPLTALRGKCRIMHRGEIDDLDRFRKTPDSFWFEKLYDRYIQKNYDLIATSSIVNVPDKVKKVLDSRWKYVLVEQGRGKELTSAVKLCKRCSGYCASNDSVDCAVCRKTYHMNCVRPPLLKKPSRGFAWSCAACSRAQQRKLEARNTPNGIHVGVEWDEEEPVDEDDDEAHHVDTDRTTTPAETELHHQGTAEQIYHASLWPWRYLGIHCKPEDALDYDDRIYPRASTRVGPRHQANVPPWPGQPVQYVKPPEAKKGGHGPKVSKDTQDAEKALRGKRPKWVQDQPPGYVARGEDYDADDPRATAEVLWRPLPTQVISGEGVEDYVSKVQGMAKRLNLPERSTNLCDVALDTLLGCDGDTSAALKAVPKLDRDNFKEPSPNAAEQKKFEEGVAKHGSELHLVRKHVKTMSPGQVVRYYYTWKKTERGQQVWVSYSGRKSKKQAKRADAAATKLADDVGDDDSAFDTAKAAEKKRSFMCHFCSTTSSRQWRRAPSTAPGLISANGSRTCAKDKSSSYVVALCRHCAELWRRYGIRYEKMEEVAKKVAQSGGRAWKRKQDELLKKLQAAHEMGLMTPDRDASPLNGSVPGSSLEPPRKKLKGAPSEGDRDPVTSDGGSISGSGLSKRKDKTATSTPVPDMPKPRLLPCAICGQMEPLGDQHLSCRECRLTVHRNCYGIVDNRVQGKWICDMCTNDKNPQVSIWAQRYKCVLCPVELTEHDFVGQAKLTHHKKMEKDREKERVDVQQARKVAEFYRKRQEELNRPPNPRETLKRTADNSWVHVTCAVWSAGVTFGNAKALEPAEGIPSIARARYDETCEACNRKAGACVSCTTCHKPYHAECARQRGHLLGFDITPVKSSRRDQVNIVTIGNETGVMVAALWCKEHIPTKTIAHPMHEVVDDAGTNALQFFVQNYKQADLTLTGTVRKANLMMNAARLPGPPAPNGGSARRASATPTTAHLTNGNGQTHHQARQSDANHSATHVQKPGGKVCISCGIDVTPKWWPIDDSQEQTLTNGRHGTIGSEAQKFVEQRRFQCHKCRKLRRGVLPGEPRSTPATGKSLHPGDLTNNGPVVELPPEWSAARNPMPPPLSDFRHLHHSGRHILLRPSSPQTMTTTASASAPALAATAHANPTLSSSSPHTQAPAAVPRAENPLHACPPTSPPRPSPLGNDWAARPITARASPPHPLHREALPCSNGSAPASAGVPPLRAPAPSVAPPPPPTASLPGDHLYGSRASIHDVLPTSPRQLNGPTPPPSFVPYHGASPHPGPQPPLRTISSPVSSNGLLPPRHEPSAYGSHGQRPPYQEYHGCPSSLPRSGLPHVLEPPAATVPAAAPRSHDNRPPSGASASPSLRNLLS